jgi:iron complex transport system substrate-binding protein
VRATELRHDSRPCGLPCGRLARRAIGRRATRCGSAISFALLLVAGAASAAAAVENRTPPSGGAARIISLVPSVTETIFALGAEDRLVAVSTYCDYPEAARRLPRAGDYLHPSVETIVALEPDVVIGVPTPGNQQAIETLRGLGVNVVVVGEDTLEDAWRSMRTIGAWVGKPAEAERLAGDVRGRIERVRARASRLPSRRVLFVIGHDPLVVVGRGRFIDELIGIAGGENVGVVLGLEWPRLSLEAVVATAPDVIIDGAMGTEAGEALTEYWSAYASVPAVRDGRVRPHRSTSLLRPGPRLGDAAEEMFALIHGDARGAAVH